MPAFTYSRKPRDSGTRRKQFPPVAAGWHVVEGIEAKWKAPTEKQGPQYLWLRLDINEGEYLGRCLFATFHLNSTNPTAREIAEERLEELMTAVGVDDLKHTDQLLNKLFKVRVAIKYSEEYGSQNEVKAYRPLGTATKDEPKVDSQPRFPMNKAKAAAEAQPAPAPAKEGEDDSDLDDKIPF